MIAPPLFLSLEKVIQEAVEKQARSRQDVLRSLAINLENWRMKQTVLHFELETEPLGPGRLVGFDIAEEKVSFQLLGMPEIVEYSFNRVSVNVAEYLNPMNMGLTLIGAFWEAKITRRYLERIVANSYARLAPEEIDAFARIAGVEESEVSALTPLDISESDIKKFICEIIGYPFPQKDWGGEICDLFCEVKFRGKRVPAAFALKGKAYADHPLRIADLGKNGDQLVRLFSQPATIYVVQSNGPIDGTVYNQIQAQVAEKIMTNQPVYYLVLDGVQTARLLRAYEKI